MPHSLTLEANVRREYLNSETTGPSVAPCYPPFPNLTSDSKICFVNTICSLGQERDQSATQHLLAGA